MSISLQPSIVYGPVLSRRLGRSLGINLLPTDRKVCSFNCLYCQYGEAKALCKDAVGGFTLPTASEVLDEVEKALLKPRTMDTLTFSGNGEPTLHPEFLEIVREVKQIRTHYRPNVRLAILSNASQVNNPDVLKALALIDAPMMKLDAGDELTFQRLNRPAAGIKFRKIVEGLHFVPGLMIQSALIEGKVTNVHGEAYENWAKTLQTLQPKKVHIYTTDRPSAVDDVQRLASQKLIWIQSDLRNRFNLDVDAFWAE